ncbi:MAG: DUF3316 domain-containing protein [Paludibacter sp.]|jgi:hypothetical protein|nr:DUF3316 domain-containing protein [Paludibacter sp.]
MRNKTLIFFCYLLFFGLVITAQTNDSTVNYLPTSVRERIALGFVNINDPYLSPLEYSGLILGAEYFAQKYISAKNHSLISEYKYNLEIATASNNSNSASMQMFDGALAWGLFKNIYRNDNFQFLAGGNIDTKLGIKYLARNVNNPVNIDFATGVNLAAALNYRLSLFNKSTLLQFKIDFPLAGVMFVPQQGASYYEMFSLGNTSNCFHFSAPYNRLGFDYSFTVDIPLSRSTLLIGIENNFLKYKANGSVYSRISNAVLVGWKYDFYVFKGKKERNAKNFMFVE